MELRCGEVHTGCLVESEGFGDWARDSLVMFSVSFSSFRKSSMAILERLTQGGQGGVTMNGADDSFPQSFWYPIAEQG